MTDLALIARFIRLTWRDGVCVFSIIALVGAALKVI